MKGLTQYAIAEELGITQPAVSQAVKKWINETREHNAESAAELREKEASRLDALIASRWECATDASRKGSDFAYDRVHKAIESRIKLFGLAVVPEQAKDEGGRFVFNVQIGAPNTATGARPVEIVPLTTLPADEADDDDFCDMPTPADQITRVSGHPGEPDLF
jgi:predicted transcriptional regulator